jgi:hypothetical protein
MFRKRNKNGAHDRSVRGGDTLGGPDPGGREDILSAAGTEPHPGKDILGGPDGPAPEDELAAPGHVPEEPTEHDILGGPDRPGPEDSMGPPRDA